MEVACQQANSEIVSTFGRERERERERENKRGILMVLN
jgi:hypothetical protein